MFVVATELPLHFFLVYKRNDIIKYNVDVYKFVFFLALKFAGICVLLPGFWCLFFLCIAFARDSVVFLLVFFLLFCSMCSSSHRLYVLIFIYTETKVHLRSFAPFNHSVYCLCVSIITNIFTVAAAAVATEACVLLFSAFFSLYVFSQTN